MPTAGSHGPHTLPIVMSSDHPLAGVSVAVDGRYANRPGVGIYRYFRQVIRLLTEAGASVVLLTNISPEAVEHDYPSVAWRTFGSRRNLTWEQFSLPRVLRRSSFDLYWAPGNMGIPGSSVRPVKTVLTLHDLVPLRLPRMYLAKRPLYAAPYFLWTTAGALRTDTIFTVSQTSARDLRALFRRESVVAPAILFEDAIAARPPDEETLRQHTHLIAPGTRYVAYNGGVEPRKNVPMLLEGFRRAHESDPDLRLVLMGRGYDALAPLVSNLGLDECVTLTGFVSEALKVAILREAVAVIYPSLYEGFGLPLLEAFANGVPVVTSRRGALGEIAGEAALYVSDPTSPGCIADALARIQDSGLRRRLIDAGMDRWRSYDARAVRELVLAELRATIER